MLYEALKACILADKVPYIEGPPGWGKSAMCKVMARILEVDCHIVYLAQRAGNEIHGIPVVASRPLLIGDQEYTVVDQAPPRAAVEARHSERGALVFLDELNQLSPTDFGQVMSIFSERLWGPIPLPRNLVGFVGAGNPPEMSAGGWRIPLPARRRVVKLEMELNVAAFSDASAFPSNWGFELPELSKFGKVLDTEDRYRTRTMLASWVHAKPDVFAPPKDISKMYEGFVCPATLEDAADLLVAVKQYTPKAEQPAVRQSLLRGVLGPAGADDLIVYLDNLDVPDAREVLDHPQTFIKSGEVPPLDKLYYFLMSLAEEQRFRTKASAEKSGNKKALERAQQSWYNGLEVAAFFKKSRCPTDMLCMFIGNLVQADVKPKGVTPPKVVDEIMPLLGTMRAAGVNWTALAHAKPGKDA